VNATRIKKNLIFESEAIRKTLLLQN